MSLFFQNKGSLFSQPYTSLFDRLNIRKRLGQAGDKFMQGNPSIEDLRLLGYTQYCGSTSDCGYGSQCVDGLCKPIGAGNTQYGEGGCSSGPSSNPPATLDCINCGYDSERSCAGTRTCRFTPFGVTCTCGQSTDTNTGDPEGEEGKPCNKYCTTEYSSYGTYGPGCSDGNTCSECYSCDGGDADNGNCTKKSRDGGAPCHCDPDPDESCTPRDEVPLTCCNYQDTCFGRIDQPYCHETYRTFYPRCYNPDCSGPFYPDDPDCLACERSWVSWNQNQTEPVIPDDASKPCYNEDGDTVCGSGEVLCTDPITGECTCRECCPQFGGPNEIINEETGDTKTFLECCRPTCQEDPSKCESSYDCGVGYCCDGSGQCVPCPTTISCERLTPHITAAFDGASFVKSSLCDCVTITVNATCSYINGKYYSNPFTGEIDCSPEGCSSTAGPLGSCLYCYCPYVTPYEWSTTLSFNANLLALSVGRFRSGGPPLNSGQPDTFVPELAWREQKECGVDSGLLPNNVYVRAWFWGLNGDEIEITHTDYLVDGIQPVTVKNEMYDIITQVNYSISLYTQDCDPISIPSNLKW